MEPTKITVNKLQSIIDDLKSGSEDARGTYLYKGFRLQISKYKASGAERTSRLYHKRREQGLCIRCGVKVTKKNPKTGKLYRLCDNHRDMIDKKEDARGEKTAAVPKTVKRSAKKSAVPKENGKEKSVAKVKKGTAKKASRKKK